MDKFSADLFVEYSEGRDKQLQVWPPSTKMTEIQPTGSSDSGLTFVPNAATYAHRSLRSLNCHCECRGAQRLKQSAGSGVDASIDDIESTVGWLAGMTSAVFVSPFSSFTPGPDGTTPSYLFYTILVTYYVSDIMFFMQGYNKGLLKRACGLGSTFIKGPAKLDT